MQKCPDACLFVVTMQRSTDAPTVLHAADLKDAYTCSHCLQNSSWYDILHLRGWDSLSCLDLCLAWEISIASKFTHAGQPIVYPRNDLTYTENILHMMFSLPSERYQVDPVLSKALEVILILHMDHEQNASTSTVRVAGQPVMLLDSIA